MRVPTRTALITLRVAPALKEAAEQAAARDHRTLTSWIEKLIHDALAQKPKR